MVVNGVDDIPHGRHRKDSTQYLGSIRDSRPLKGEVWHHSTEQASTNVV